MRLTIHKPIFYKSVGLTEVDDQGEGSCPPWHLAAGVYTTLHADHVYWRLHLRTSVAMHHSKCFSTTAGSLDYHMDRDMRKYLVLCNYSSGTQIHHLPHRLVVFKSRCCRWRRLYHPFKMLNPSGLSFLDRVFRIQRERFRQQDCACSGRQHSRLSPSRPRRYINISMAVDCH